MKLRQLTGRVFFLPHEPERDRPALAYVRGERFSLAIDAGYSPEHVEDFYGALEAAGFSAPDFTVLTHWHYDHTFGLCRTGGVSIAHEQTGAFLERERERARDPRYLEELRVEDPCFAREYGEGRRLEVIPPDLTFRDRLTLDLGGLTARVFHTEAPHSEDTVCVEIPGERVLFLGDSICGDFFNGGYLDREKLRKLARVIKDTDCALCVLNHAEPLGKGELMDYLRGIL